jgi:hypothetical protein
MLAEQTKGTQGWFGLRSACWIVLLALLTACTPQATVRDLQALKVTEAYAIPGFGFGIDHPEGWQVETDAETSVTRINQYRRHPDRGVRILLDYEPLETLQADGLQENPALEQLAEFNATYFDIPEEVVAAAVVSEATIFGVPSLRVRFTQADGQSVDALQGLIGESVFLLWAATPTEAHMEAFAPTWEAMLASIRHIDAD